MSHVDPFNALGGFSVGIPPELVIDETGNVVNNVNAPNSNVTANRVFANGYFYANGAPLSIGASGSNTQVQYNNNGLLGASSAFTFNSATSLLTVSKLQASNNANLGNVANIIILGGTNGYFLQTDGAGNLTWAPAGNGGNGGNGSPAGANTQVQFNNEGNFGGDAGFTYNSVTNLLSAGNVTTGNISANYVVLNWDLTANVVVANYLYGDGSNITNVHAITSDVAYSVAGANVTGEVNFAAVANSVAGANVTGQVAFANVANNVAGANVSGQVANALVAGTVYNSTQANITSLGNLTSLTVVGNTTLGNQVTANYFLGNLFGTANLARNVTLASQPNITSVGTLTTLSVSGNTTLGNSVTANYFVGNLYGVANSATIANVANLATLANTATLANAANIAGTVTVNAQPNITSVGTLSSLAVTGNVTAGNFVGNFVGNIDNANFAAFAGNVVNASQPNITSLGTLTGLTVAGTLNATGILGPLLTNVQPNITSLGTLVGLNVNGNVVAANFTANTGVFTGNGSGLSQLVAANIVGTVANATYAANAGHANTATSATSALTAVSVTSSSQPNITSVGTLSALNVNGTANLGAVGNVKITGGTNGYVLSTDGAGNLSWVIQSNGGGGNGTPAGSNTQLQYNDSGSFGASGNLTWNNTTRYLYVGGNANFASNVTAPIFKSNVANGTAPFVVESVTPVANLSVETAGTVRNAAQPNITSIGTLSSLVVSGNISAGNIATGLVTGTLTTNAQPNITSLGTLANLAVAGTANLGAVGNVKITGGTNGYVLSTDGVGNLSWVAQSGNGGNGTPGGSNTQVQFNSNGTFGGSPNFTWNSVTNTLVVTGNSTISGNINVANVVSNNVSSTTINATGNITAGNVNGGNLVSANYLQGTLTTSSQLNINYLGNVGWLNVDTGIANANGNITFNGSINGIGAASNIVVTGNVDAGNYVQANYLVGVITTGAQPNITSLGNLTSLTVVGTTDLGNVSNITIDGGSPNYVLSTDGAGNLSWVAPASGGNGSPGGLNTYIQFNDGGSFGGDNAFTWNKVTNYLYVGGNANYVGNITASAFISNIATGNPPFQVDSTTPVANLGVQTAATVRDNAQPNITSLGTLTSLSVSGNGIFTNNLSVTSTFNAGNITTPGTIGTTNLNVTGTANFSNTAVVSGSGTLTVNGKFNSAGASNVNLGSIANLHISGGINGYVLATDGNANLYWTAGGGGGGNGTPGGSNTQIQYNNAGDFGGSPNFTFDAANSNVQVAGNLIANTLTLGAGVYEFSHSNVYFATTASAAANQIILSIPAEDIAAVDYTIISTESAGSTRNFVKISTVVYGNSINYVEYSTLPVNGYVGDFTVTYNAGNIITPASIQLKFSPQSANSMTHKMLLTTYKE